MESGHFSPGAAMIESVLNWVVVDTVRRQESFFPVGVVSATEVLG